MIQNHPQDAEVLDDKFLSNHFSDWFLKLKDQVNRGTVPHGTTDVTATGGIAIPSAVNGIMIRIQSATAGAINITANPQIEFGFDGQRITIEGMDATKTVQLDDGDGLKLAGGASFIVASDDTISFVFNDAKSLWIETARSNN